MYIHGTRTTWSERQKLHKHENKNHGMYTNTGDNTKKGKPKLFPMFYTLLYFLKACKIVLPEFIIRDIILLVCMVRSWWGQGKYHWRWRHLRQAYFSSLIAIIDLRFMLLNIEQWHMFLYALADGNTDEHSFSHEGSWQFTVWDIW